jgi:hypothetical protein
MKLSFGKTFRTAPMMLAITLVLGVCMQLQAQEASHTLVGTWHVTVTTYNCSTGVQGPAFQSLLAFDRGGTMSGTTSNPIFQPGQRTPDFGIWHRVSPHTYTAVSDAYILFGTAPTATTPGVPKSTQRLTQAISVNGDGFVSEASVQFVDLSNNVLASLCAHAKGERFK